MRFPINQVFYSKIKMLIIICIDCSNDAITIQNPVILYFLIPSILLLESSFTDCGITLENKQKITTETWGIVENDVIKNMTEKEYPNYLFMNYLRLFESKKLTENFCYLKVYEGPNYADGLEKLLEIKTTLLVYNYDTTCYFNPQYNNCSKQRLMVIGSIVTFSFGLGFILACVCICVKRSYSLEQLEQMGWIKDYA